MSLKKHTNHDSIEIQVAENTPSEQVLAVLKACKPHTSFFNGVDAIEGINGQSVDSTNRQWLEHEINNDPNLNYEVQGNVLRIFTAIEGSDGEAGGHKTERFA